MTPQLDPLPGLQSAALSVERAPAPVKATAHPANGNDVVAEAGLLQGHPPLNRSSTRRAAGGAPAGALDSPAAGPADGAVVLSEEELTELKGKTVKTLEGILNRAKVPLAGKRTKAALVELAMANPEAVRQALRRSHGC